MVKEQPRNGKGRKKVANAAGILFPWILDELRDPEKREQIEKFMAGAAKSAQKVAGNAKDAASKNLHKMKEKQDEKKNLSKASLKRKQKQEIALQNVHFSVDEFVEKAHLAQEDGHGFYDVPGCFLIVSYAKPPKKRTPLTGYSGIFIESTQNLREGILLQISGKGNSDIYADIKYQRTSTYVVLFPESGQRKPDIEQKTLIELFDDGSNRLYNKL